MKKKIFLLNELVEPRQVKGLRYSKRIHNKGTNIATELYVWKFTTSKGNVVEIVFKPTSGEKAYEVSFAVNKEMDATKSGGDSDKEIMSGVFSLLPNLANKLGAQNLTMEAYEERPEQFRVIKNKDYQQLEKSLSDELKRSIAQETNPLVKEKLQKAYQSIFVDKVDVSNIYTLITREGNKFQKLNNLFDEYRSAVLSNKEGGHKIKINRRYNIYKQLLPRYMKDWEITEYPNYFYFELTKKNVQHNSLNEQHLVTLGVDEDSGDIYGDEDEIEELGFLRYEDVFEQAGSLAYNLGIGITRDRQLKYVVFDQENENLMVGALFTSLENNIFSFDIVVHKKYQRTGIGTYLTKIALEEYQNLAYDYDGLKLKVDVINPVAKDMLIKKFNFRVIKKLTPSRWLMTAKKN